MITKRPDFINCKCSCGANAISVQACYDAVVRVICVEADYSHRAPVPCVNLTPFCLRCMGLVFPCRSSAKYALLSCAGPFSEVVQ